MCVCACVSECPAFEYLEISNTTAATFESSLLRINLTNSKKNRRGDIMPGPRLNVNERSLYTRKMIAEKNANRLLCVCVLLWLYVCLSGRERCASSTCSFFFGQFLLNDQSPSAVVVVIVVVW